MLQFTHTHLHIYTHIPTYLHTQHAYLHTYNIASYLSITLHHVTPPFTTILLTPSPTRWIYFDGCQVSADDDRDDEDGEDDGDVQSGPDVDV